MVQRRGLKAYGHGPTGSYSARGMDFDGRLREFVAILGPCRLGQVNFAEHPRTHGPPRLPANCPLRWFARSRPPRAGALRLCATVPSASSFNSTPLLPSSRSSKMFSCRRGSPGQRPGRGTPGAGRSPRDRLGLGSLGIGALRDRFPSRPRAGAPTRGAVPRPWSTGRRFCWPTSLPATSTRPTGTGYSRTSRTWRARAAPRSSWSLMTNPPRSRSNPTPPGPRINEGRRWDDLISFHVGGGEAPGA